MRLLLVEDHERFAEFVKTGLENDGFTVDAVTTAANADAAFSTVKYDAIVLDLGLPDADGLTLLISWCDQGDSTAIFLTDTFEIKQVEAALKKVTNIIECLL